jgi:SAM-dependent methyltransferase
MRSEDNEEHWDRIYEARPSHDLGWYEPRPSTLGLVVAHSVPTDSVIDVGGGDGRLVDELIERGYDDVTVLDVSHVALSRSQSRLGERAQGVSWIRADVTQFAPQRRWDLWHDRAVFHFLVEKDDAEAYRATARQALAPGGRLAVAAFSHEAPERCAGLPVARYDIDSLVTAFAPDFEPISVGHLTSAGSGVGDQRPYVGAVFGVI